MRSVVGTVRTEELLKDIFSYELNKFIRSESSISNEFEVLIEGNPSILLEVEAEKLTEEEVEEYKGRKAESKEIMDTAVTLEEFKSLQERFHYFIADNELQIKDVIVLICNELAFLVDKHQVKGKIDEVISSTYLDFLLMYQAKSVGSYEDICSRIEDQIEL